jgi:hypothetical protein
MCHPMTRALTLSIAAGKPALTELPPIDGTLEHATTDFLGVRTSDGRYRLIHAEPPHTVPPPCHERVR